MQNPEVWDEVVAEWMARNLEGVQQMTERHWRLLGILGSTGRPMEYAHQ